MEREEPEKVAVTLDGFLGKSPSSCACMAALTSLFLHAKSAFVVTALPSKNLKGFGNLEFAVEGKVVGTVHVASWRFSVAGAARTVVARSGKTSEYFMVGDLVIL